MQNQVKPVLVGLMVSLAGLSCGDGSVPPGSDDQLLTQAEKVKLVRSLTEQAALGTTDPIEARPLLERACDISDQLPRQALASTMVRFDPNKFSIEHLMYLMEWTTTYEIRNLSKRIQLVEQVRITRAPFMAQVHSHGGGVWAERSACRSRDKQTLLFGGKRLYWTTVDSIGTPQFKIYHVSPDERFVVLEDEVHVKPLEILDIARVAKVHLQAPAGRAPRQGQHPLEFVRWEKDSKHFLVRASRIEQWDAGDSESRPHDANALWRADPRTGAIAAYEP